MQCKPPYFFARQSHVVSPAGEKVVTQFALTKISCMDHGAAVLALP